MDAGMDRFGSLSTVDEGPPITGRGCTVPFGYYPMSAGRTITKSQPFVACPAGLPYDTEHSDCQTHWVA
jgi:hypothetical protein